MSTDLASLRTELQTLLDDSDGSLYPQSVLDSCLRQALAELQSVCPQTLSIAGLDSALESSLDGMAQLLLRFARLQAVNWRIQQRSETYDPVTRDQPLRQFYQQEQQALALALQQRRQHYLHNGTLPYALWPEIDETLDETE